MEAVETSPESGVAGGEAGPSWPASPRSPRHDRGLAVHEASHVTAGWILGREIGSVTVEARPEAEVGKIRADLGPGDVDLDDVIDDLVVFVIPNVTAGRSIPRRPASPRDERDALDLARRFTGTEDEAHALLELGRARARTLAGSPLFADLAAAVTDALAERGSLDPAELREIFEPGGDLNGETRERRRPDLGLL